MNERGSWTTNDETNTHDWDKLLAGAIITICQNLQVKSIIDIGCGNGGYTMNFLKHGINCVGYDGSPLTPEITKSICQIKDFSEIVDLGKFDLVLSLEVGEHIPVKYEQIFIDNVCHAAKDLITISWGIEGQLGYGHVNCRNNDYVIAEFEKRNFIFDKETTDYLREKSTFHWFKNTILCFKS